MKIKYPQICDDKFLKSRIESGVRICDLAREIGCGYDYLRSVLIKKGIFQPKEHNDCSHVEFGNWKTGKILKTKGVKNLKKLFKWTHNFMVHIYPVVRGERILHEEFCLAENLKTEYEIITDGGILVKFKNWIKFARTRGLSPIRFKELLDGEIIYYHGFYLKKNEDIIPRKLIKVFKIEMGDEILEIENLAELAKLIDVHYKTIYNLANGITIKNRQGLKLKEVNFR